MKWSQLAVILSSGINNIDVYEIYIYIHIYDVCNMYVYIYIYAVYSIQYTIYLYIVIYIYIYTYIETWISLSVQVAQKFRPLSGWFEAKGMDPKSVVRKWYPSKNSHIDSHIQPMKKETHLPKQLGMDYVSLRSVSELQFWSVAQGVFYLVCCIFEPSAFLT